MSEHLVCTACGHREPIEPVPSTCGRCDGILDFRVADGSQEAAPSGMWRWAAHLPNVAPKNRVVLGEGDTPLLSAPRLGAALGLSDLWIKNESLNPTGSFKDRAVALAASLAVEHQRRGVVLSSSGNAGAAAAAYAARAGLPAVVLAPATASQAKLRQILVTGATLIPVQGQTSDCCRLARQAARELGFVNVTTTFYCPYGVDAYATIAFELAEAKSDTVLVPISSGPILAGVAKGFEQLLAAGLIERMPQLVAVQSAACQPIVQAFEAGTAVQPWAHRHTVASALNDTLDGYERDGDYVLSFLRKHGGQAVAVSDAAVLEATRQLARLEGIVVEPSAAATVAALAPLHEKGLLRAGERVVAVSTGHGLKDMPDAVVPPLPGAIPPNLEALAAHL